MKKNKLRKLYNYFNKRDISKQAEIEPYGIKINVDALSVRKGPGDYYDIVGVVKEGYSFVIVEEYRDKDGEVWGLLKACRRDRDGWINLKYTKKK